MKIELTLEEVNTCLLALSKLPFEQVNALIVSIRAQGEKQLQEQSAPPEPEEVKVNSAFS